MGWWVNFRGADQMPGTCNERSIDLSVSATGFSPIEDYSQTDRQTLADFRGIIGLGEGL
jgi:hypothetical protein